MSRYLTYVGCVLLGSALGVAGTYLSQTVVVHPPPVQVQVVCPDPFALTPEEKVQQDKAMQPVQFPHTPQGQLLKLGTAPR
jgi:hypothetical protein